LVAKRAADDRLLLELEIGRGNLPVKRTLSSGDEHTFKYDKAGRYLVAATRKDRVEFVYDKLGNACAEKRNGCGVERHFHNRKMTEPTIFSRFVVHHERDANGTLIITDPGRKRHQIRIHPYGVVERRLSNGSQEYAQYDSQGRCLFKYARRTRCAAW